MSDPDPKADPQGNAPRSMRQFDYFADEAKPVDPETLSGTLPESLEDQLLTFRREQKRLSRYLLLAVAVLAVSSWFLWGYRFEFRYAFSAAREPFDVGDVVDLRPRDLPHNAYVKLRGITEHRGLVQKMVRGLSVSRREYWYFRLLGSRGIFIEVGPDAEKYGFATEVEVAGRVVDPNQDALYRLLLGAYQDRFLPEQRAELRVVQVGVVPGAGRLPYVAALVSFGLLAGLNIWVAGRLFKHQRRVPGIRR